MPNPLRDENGGKRTGGRGEGRGRRRLRPRLWSEKLESKTDGYMYMCSGGGAFKREVCPQHVTHPAYEEYCNFFRAHLSSFSCISRSSRPPPPSSRRTRALMDIRDRRERPGLSPPVLNSGKTRFGRLEKNPGPCLESSSTPCCCAQKAEATRKKRAWHVRPSRTGPTPFFSRNKVKIVCHVMSFCSDVSRISAHTLYI